MFRRSNGHGSELRFASKLSALILGIAFSSGSQAQAQTINCASPTQAPLAKSMRQDVKFFAGHYVYVSSPYEYNLVIPTLKEVGDIPSVKGVMKRYAWSTLEPTLDNYSGIDLIKKDLDLVRAKGKKLAVMIQYKFLSTDPNYPNPMPNYLKDLTGNDYYYVIGGKPSSGASANGYLAKFANPIVVRRFVKLLSKLKALDTDDALAAIVFAETANGVRNELINEPAYYDGLMKTDRAASCYFLKTPVIQLTNYPKQDEFLKDLFVKTYLDYSIGYGGPDVYLADSELNTGAYSFHPLLNSKLPIGMVVAAENFEYSSQANHVAKISNGLAVPDSVSRIANFATGQLASNFIFWRKEKRDDPYYLEVLKRLRNGSMPSTIKTCPSIYDCQ
jgi:hypothetical protein